MKDLNIVVQLVSAQYGFRTPPVTTTRSAFAAHLASASPETIKPDSMYVLVLADDSLSPDVLDFSVCPLMTIPSFISKFSISEVHLHV